MGLNEAPSGERVHIGFFGRRNAGKSSLVNAVTDQEISVVSDTKGTTTDPVTKAMELLPLGPVVIIDTPGFDDEGSLGEKRVQRAKRVMNRTDIAVLVIDASTGAVEADRELAAMFKEKEIPFLTVVNKADLLESGERERLKEQSDPGEIMFVSALSGEGIFELKEKLAKMGSAKEKKTPLIEDLIHPSQIVVLVIPIDKAAPKGRLILPQQMMIRGILDADGIPVCVKQDRLKETLERLGTDPVTGRSPAELVITVAAQSVLAAYPVLVELRQVPTAIAILGPYGQDPVAAHLEVTSILNGGFLEVEISAKAGHLSCEIDIAPLGGVIDVVTGICHMLEGDGTGGAEVVFLPVLIMVAPVNGAVRIGLDHIAVIHMPYI